MHRVLLLSILVLSCCKAESTGSSTPSAPELGAPRTAPPAEKTVSPATPSAERAVTPAAPSAAGTVSTQAIDGFPLPVPTGVADVEVRNATTEKTPTRGADAELVAKLSGDPVPVIDYYQKLLTDKGLSVERQELERDSGPEGRGLKVRLERLVAKKESTRVFIVIQRGSTSHQLKMAVAGPI